MNKNYYLNLLNKKVNELQNILLEMENSNFSDDYKKYLISGYIITLSSILEVGIGDFHSDKFDELSTLIYYTRQKIVHYGLFNGLKDVEEAAYKIVELTKENYKSEVEFYENLFDLGDIYEVNNIVVEVSSNIIKDPHFYKFVSKDKKQVLNISPTNIFFLTKKSSDKVLSYIIDTQNPAGLYFYTEDGKSGYKELNSEEIKQFLKKNFACPAEDYNEHLIVMQNIINSFISDPINSMQIMEQASDEQFCRNTIEIIKLFILERKMYASYIESNFLIKDKYSLSKMQKTDYDRLYKDIKKNAYKYIDEKDVFFIDMTLRRAKYYSDYLSDSKKNSDIKPEVLNTVLVQLFECGPKHFSNKLISSSPEFKKCYSNLLRYRQIFSHYILTNKEYKDTIARFKQEFVGLIKVLDSMDLSYIQTPMSVNCLPYLTIERNKDQFFNYKHEQFLKINKDTYIGKKIYYSSHNPTSHGLIAVLPSGNNIANTSYYCKNLSGELTQKHIADENSGKSIASTILNTPLRGAKQIEMDMSFSALFKAYFELRKLCNKSNKITINFHACKANTFYAHKDDLSMVILRFFNQGYIPAELLQEIKVDESNLSKGFVHLLDKKDNVVATIIHEKKCSFKHNYTVDSEDYFSRIDNIEHDFSKRRPSNV